MTTDAEPLLHLIGAAQWRVALDAGAVVDASLVTDGYIRLSGAEQIAAAAERNFPHRDDLLVLVIDRARLRDEVRSSHLFGPLPVAAVTSVLPHRPAPGGGFVAPDGIPPVDDVLARATTFERSLAERRAAAVLPVTGGVACLDPRVPASWENNSLWITGAVDAATIVAESDRALAGLAHRRVVTFRPPPDDLGWEVEELRIAVLDPAAPDPPEPGVAVRAVTQEVMAGLWAPNWQRDLPGVDDVVVADLVRRESFANAHVRIVDLAVLGDDGVPVAGTQLRIDGATAAIEAVMTSPSARKQGHGRALVGDAIRRARALNCDVIWLLCLSTDWPRWWYERMGFVDVGARWEAVRS